jgi:hypothetical protein
VALNNLNLNLKPDTTVISWLLLPNLFSKLPKNLFLPVKNAIPRKQVEYFKVAICHEHLAQA